MLRYWTATVVTHCIDLTARGSTWPTSSTSSSSSSSPSPGPGLSAGLGGTTGEEDVTTCPPAPRTGEDNQDHNNPSVKLSTQQLRPDRASYSSPQDHQLARDWHLWVYAVHPLPWSPHVLDICCLGGTQSRTASGEEEDCLSQEIRNCWQCSPPPQSPVTTYCFRSTNMLG